jgi:hypothetical protein
MHPLTPLRADIAAACARAERLSIELQQTRWVAARARYRSRLTRLARYMPQANNLTLVITDEILLQHGLHIRQFPFQLASDAHRGLAGGTRHRRGPGRPSRVKSSTPQVD